MDIVMVILASLLHSMVKTYYAPQYTKVVAEEKVYYEEDSTGLVDLYIAAKTICEDHGIAEDYVFSLFFNAEDAWREAEKRHAAMVSND